MYSIYDCLGQSSFSFRIPSAPLRVPRIRTSMHNVTVSQIQPGSGFRVISVGMADDFKIQDCLSDIFDRRFFLEFGQVPIRDRVISIQVDVDGQHYKHGNVNQAYLSALIRCLGLPLQGYELWPEPGRDYRIRGASAQVRSRGGFATLFGVAAGYALAGLPGAAIGAAVSRVL
jgi:hypothetical protein